MDNSKISEALYELAELLSLKNVRYKSQAYQRAARTIESLPNDVSKLYKKRGNEGLDEIPGVGVGIAKKIEEFIRSGKIKRSEQLKKEAGKGISGLLKVPGIGPEKVKKLMSELDIKSVKGLKRAAKKGEIRNVEGFGEKSEKDILQGLGLTSVRDKISYSEAKKYANKLVSYMKKSGVDKIDVAGSFRRKKKMVRDLDIIVSSENPEKVIKRFVEIPDIKKVFSKGKRKASVVLESGVQADLRVFDKDSWGAGLFYFTGNKNYNIKMRKIAIMKGYKLSEYGLYDKKSGKKVAGRSEKEICKKLGVEWKKPGNREI